MSLTPVKFSVNARHTSSMKSDKESENTMTFPSMEKSLYAAVGSDKVVEKTKVELSLHAMAIKLIYDLMQTEAGRDNVKAIIKIAMFDFPSNISENAELVSARGDGNLLTFFFESTVATPDALKKEMAQPVKPFQMAFTPKPVAPIPAAHRALVDPPTWSPQWKPDFTSSAQPNAVPKNILGNSTTAPVLFPNSTYNTATPLPTPYHTNQGANTTAMPWGSIPTTVPVVTPGYWTKPTPANMVPEELHEAPALIVETKTAGTAQEMLNTPKSAATDSNVIIVRTALDSYHFLNAKDESRLEVASTIDELNQVAEDIERQWQGADGSELHIELDRPVWRKIHNFFV